MQISLTQPLTNKAINACVKIEALVKAAVLQLMSLTVTMCVDFLILKTRISEFYGVLLDLNSYHGHLAFSFAQSFIAHLIIMSIPEGVFKYIVQTCIHCCVNMSMLQFS
jgi:hypothetical protein